MLDETVAWAPSTVGERDLWWGSGGGGHKARKVLGRFGHMLLAEGVISQDLTGFSNSAVPAE
jgi:hypothetical protein